MKMILRYILVLVLCIVFCSISSVSYTQHIEQFGSFVKVNYPQMGHRSSNHWMIPRELRNLKGPVKQLTQYAYGPRDVLIPFDNQTRTDSYSYIFDNNKKVVEIWMFLDHDVPAFKEFYYDFKEDRPQYHMKFYAPLRMSYSKTFQYNNRHIPIGKKTTAGDDLTIERYQLDIIKDTLVVYANDFNKEFYSNHIVKTFNKKNQELESLTYHDNGSVHECLLYHNEVLSEAFEYDTLGRLIEHQTFKTKPVFNIDNDSSKPLGYGKLIIYEYNNYGLLQSEKHRYVDTVSAPYRVNYYYDKQQRLEKRTVEKGDSVVRTDAFSYNEHDDRVPITEAGKQIVEYANYDDHGNWTKRIVHTSEGKRRFVRRIEYFE